MMFAAAAVVLQTFSKAHIIECTHQLVPIFQTTRLITLLQALAARA